MYFAASWLTRHESCQILCCAGARAARRSAWNHSLVVAPDHDQPWRGHHVVRAPRGAADQSARLSDLRLVPAPGQGGHRGGTIGSAHVGQHRQQVTTKVLME
jgi:hypothetical protein